MPLEPISVDLRDLREHDVLLEVAFCGICHSDIHQVRDEWMDGIYPMVPGHEITGVVAAVGTAVTRYAAGDRVGIGGIVDSCRSCEFCEAGEEQLCAAGATLTYNSRDRNDGTPTYGGYGTHVVADENYVLRIPEGLDLDMAAPLMCCGVTVHSPLTRYGAAAGRRVAVVGLGGLGHMGVKIASALGADVTALTRSRAKHSDALRMGADRAYATEDQATFSELAGAFDLILSTIAIPHDLTPHLGLLKRGGVLVNLGMPDQSVSLSLVPLTFGCRTITGSLIGGIDQTQRTLNFCADHKVVPEIETIAPAQVNHAFERVLNSNVRYRFVIDAGAFQA
jgi:uncharacterized zinc-type alcohol dehydrogenase-like protein